MKTLVIRTVAILIGVGMLSACSPAWILGGFKLDTVELPIIDTLSGRDFPLFDTRPANTPPQITIITPSLGVESGETVFLGPNDPIKSLYAVSDAEDGAPALRILSSVDGPLPPKDFSFSGPGPRVLTITATDTQDASTQATLTINVLPTSPDHSSFAQDCARMRAISCP
jgi:hypothetical protein